MKEKNQTLIEKQDKEPKKKDGFGDSRFPIAAPATTDGSEAGKNTRAKSPIDFCLGFSFVFFFFGCLWSDRGDTGRLTKNLGMGRRGEQEIDGIELDEDEAAQQQAQIEG